jgi:amidohydrolase
MSEAETAGEHEHLTRLVADHHDELVMLRRHLHANPERSGEEHATTELICERLGVMGLAPRILPSGTGVICDLGEPAPGGIVAIRADIDALAMPDDKEVSYRSNNPGVAHACGHDVHTTVVLGAGIALAELLAARGDSRSVRLIFEPSEETVPGGAVEVIAEGGLDGVRAVLGMHCDPKIDVGTVGLRDGAITWAADLIEIELAGPGGHTARPERTVDLTALAARLVLELPDRVRSLAGGELLLVFGSVFAGEAANVIPAHGVLRGSFRTPDPSVWAAGERLLRQALDAVLAESGAAGRGASASLHYRVGVPPVVNDGRVNAAVRAAAAEVLGPTGVLLAEESRGGDSFAWYAERVPSAYVRLGTHDPNWPGERLDIHSGRFDVDERAIGFGVQVLAGAALRLLAEG